MPSIRFGASASPVCAGPSAPPAPATTRPRPAATEKIRYDLSDLGPWREFAVVLHNDEEHSQLEVVVQLMKALECPQSVAFTLMRRVEEAGKAVVATASRERAMRIGTVLQRIGLTVEVRQIN